MSYDKCYKTMPNHQKYCLNYSEIVLTNCMLAYIIVMELPPIFKINYLMFKLSNYSKVIRNYVQNFNFVFYL